MSFTIVTHVYNQYQLLRQLIESIQMNLDPRSYDEIIIVDDYSDTKGRLRAYEEYLTRNYPYIKVINFPESRPSVYMVKDEFGLKEKIDFTLFDNPDNANMGPVMATKLGLINVKADFALKVDTDIIFLKKPRGALLTELAMCFEQHESIMCIGQVMGIKSNGIIEFYKAFDPPGCPHTAYKQRGGYPGPMAYACRMAGFSDYNLLMMYSAHPIKDERIIQGWEHREYIADIFRKGYTTCNFPLYSKGYLVHVGGASCFNLGKKENDKWKLGFTKDFNRRYGGRNTASSLWDWYSGCHMINMTAQEYASYLHKIYAADFKEIQRGIDDKLISLIDEDNEND